MDRTIGARAAHGRSVRHGYRGRRHGLEPKQDVCRAHLARRCIARRASRWLLDAIHKPAASVATTHCRYIPAPIAVSLFPIPPNLGNLPIGPTSQSQIETILASTSTGSKRQDTSIVYYYRPLQLPSPGKHSVCNSPCNSPTGLVRFRPLAPRDTGRCLAHAKTRYLTVEPDCSLAYQSTFYTAVSSLQNRAPI
jgi:hypothetical protein